MATTVVKAATPILLFHSLLVISSPAASAEKEPDTGTETKTAAEEIIEQVIVTGRRSNQQVKQLIGAIGHLDSAELQLVGHQHIHQAATRLPGVWLSRGNGQELLAAVRSPVFTGPGSCGEVLTTEDGLAIRPTGLCNVNQLFEVNTEQASGLEVWRGPGTVFYGSNAIHGVINSLSPTIERNYLSLEAGSHDYQRIKLGWRQEFGDHQWQLAGNGTVDNGFKEYSGFDQQKLSLKHQWRGSNVESTTHLSMVNLNQETAGFIRGLDTYRDPQLRQTNPNPEAYRDGRALRLSTALSGGSESAYQWQLRPYLRHSSMDFLQHFLPGQPREKNGQTSAGFQASRQQSPSTNSVLWLGADMEWARIWLEEFQTNILNSPDNVRFQGQHYDFEVESGQLATFANYEYQQTEQLTIEAGVRLETIHYDYSNLMLSGTTRDDGTACNSSDGSCRYFRPEDRSDRFNNLNTQLGASYQLNPEMTVYSRLASAFRAPQVTELYRLQREQQIEDIKPVELQSFELGLRYNQGNLGAELNLYAMNKEQVIVKDSEGFLVNDGETSHRGIEWQLGYAISRSWQLATSGSWAVHRYENSSPLNGSAVNGNDMDTAPHHLGSARLGYQPSTNSSTELQWVYLGSYFLDASNEHRYPGHNLLNLSWQRSFQQWDLRLRINNLANRKIADRADYAFGSYRYFAGEGRSTIFQIKYYL